MSDQAAPDLISALIAVATQWGDAHGDAPLSRLAKRVAGDARFFDRVAQPATSCRVDTLERFARYLHEPANWPEGLVPVEACELAHRVGVSADGAAVSAGKAGELSSQRSAA